VTTTNSGVRRAAAARRPETYSADRNVIGPPFLTGPPSIGAL
jgi:hypothetical protein